MRTQEKRIVSSRKTRKNAYEISTKKSLELTMNIEDLMTLINNNTLVIDTEGVDYVEIKFTEVI